MIALHPFSVRATRNQAHLRILETTDVHAHIYPYDYYVDQPRNDISLALTASLIKDTRNQAGNSLLIDNGDFLQGNPMGDYIAFKRGMKSGDTHPVIAAMNAVGFDAATVGNHEFNYGLEFLLDSLAGANFPVVCANVVTEMGAEPRDDKTLLKPYVILEKNLTDGDGISHPIKIGLIGFVPPQIMTWDRGHLEGKVMARDIVATARAYVPEMKEAGADIIIALAHSGIAASDTDEGLENAALQLGLLDGIDAILAGHHHQTFPGPHYAGIAGVDAIRGTLYGTPATMAGFWGNHLGIIDLMLERSGNKWRVIGSDTDVRPISKRNLCGTTAPLVDSQQYVLDSVQNAHDETLECIRRAVGKTAAPLHSYFAMVTDDPSMQIVSKVQKTYITEMLKRTEYAKLPVLSATTPFKAGGLSGPEYYTDVPIGDVAVKSISDLYLYPNTADAVKVTGTQLKDWLERSAGMFNQIKTGKPDQVLLNPDFPSYYFDVIDGVDYEIDVSQPSRFCAEGNVINPAANRISSLTYQGSPVTDDMSFVIATNSFRASGSGRFPGAMGDTVIFNSPDTNRDILIRHILKEGTIDPKTTPNWRFKSLSETTVLFDTGPKARDYLDDLKNIKIEPMDANIDGFARFRINLDNSPT